MNRMVIIASGLDLWNPWKLVPQITTIVLTTIFVIIIALIYFLKIKKLKADEEPRGLVLLIELYIKGIENLIVSILGAKFKRLTLYFIYLLSYIIIGNLLGILGFESQLTSYTTAFALALITFIGIYVFGLKYQKLAFFKRFLNPLEIFTQFVPLLSLSFRIFGNVLGGSIILTLLYWFGASITQNIPVIGQVNFIGGIIAPFFHFYFDIFFGIIQAYIFTILTIVYWKLEIPDTVSQKEIMLTNNRVDFKNNA